MVLEGPLSCLWCLYIFGCPNSHKRLQRTFQFGGVLPSTIPPWTYPAHLHLREDKQTGSFYHLGILTESPQPNTVSHWHSPAFSQVWFRSDQLVQDSFSSVPATSAQNGSKWLSRSSMNLRPRAIQRQMSPSRSYSPAQE